MATRIESHPAAVHGYTERREIGQEVGLSSIIETHPHGLVPLATKVPSHTSPKLCHQWGPSAQMHVPRFLIKNTSEIHLEET